MMDFLVLLLVKEITKLYTTYIRITVSSLVCALLTCLIIVLPIPYANIKFVLFHVILNTIMIKIGFKINDKKEFLKCLITLYFVSFLLGGVFTYFQQYLKISSLFFLMAIFSFWIVRGLCNFIKMMNHNQKKWCDVELYILDHVIHVKALLDTGNILRDPYTDQPVSVIEKASLKGVIPQKIGEELGLSCRYIPYHSLGYQGVMQAVKITKLHICGDNEYWIESPLIALSDDTLSANHNYQMILNPEIL